MNAKLHRLFITLTLCLSFILTSCTSTGPRTSKHAQGPAGETALVPTSRQSADYSQSGDHYLSLAKENPSQMTEYNLLAADMYAQAEDQVKAESLLAQIQKTNLSQTQQLRWAYIEAHLALLKGQPQIALNMLPASSDAMRASPDLQRRYLTLKALAHARLNQNLESVQARLKLDPLFVDPDQVAANRQEIWRGLNNLSAQTLAQLDNPNTSTIDRGWYRLAQINLQYNTHSDSLNQQFAAWRQSYPLHPGNDVLPKNIAIAPRSGDLPSEPRKVALLLPLSGKHSGPASAIRDGFLAGFYQGKDRPSVQPEIRIYDTAAHSDITRTYEQAIQEGADFVVGPLAKEDVLALSRLSDGQMPVPVIALNHNDQIQLIPEKFYQFSLAPENEAAAVAEKAYADGYRRAGVVVPNNAWGQRVAASFKAYWHAKGGHVVRTVEVDPNRDQAAPIRSLLNIDQSHQRANDVKNIIGGKVEFQARRRQDIDFIMLAAPPEQARQLRPLFDFYYAGSLPVYATSSIYSGTPNPAKDRDMNGILFCDMPWILDGQHPAQSARNQIQTSIPGAGGQYDRLYAMGVDAFVLTSQLARLSQYQNMGLPAATGTLYLGPKHQIERHLKWAKIENGVPKPL